VTVALSRHHRETLRELQAAGATTVASRLCFLVPLAYTGSRSKVGHCFDCDPDAKLPMPLGSRRECAKFRIPIDEYRQTPWIRSLRYNLPQARNDRQQKVLEEVCRSCKAFRLEGRCKSLVGRCGRSAYDAYDALLGDAHQWCPVWLEKLGLIRTVEEVRERVDEFIDRLKKGATNGTQDPRGYRDSLDPQRGLRPSGVGRCDAVPAGESVPAHPDVLDESGRIDRVQPEPLQALGCAGRIRPVDRPGFTGRGIVICGGGEKYLPGTYVLLRMLRHLGCTLPIEVWHLGPREMQTEWGERLARYLGHGGAIRDAYRVADEIEQAGLAPRASPGMPVAAALCGYEAKLFALQWSRFEEVLLLDADNMPVRDPTFLFDEPAYLDHGAVFWPDTPSGSPNHRVLLDTWRAFGIPDEEYREEREHETGQVLADKRRTWDCLTLANWYMQNGRNFFFKYQLGDKDVPHLAWRKLRQEFALVPHGPLTDVRGCLIQTDVAGQRLFQHRIGAKFRLPAAANQRLSPFIEEKFAGPADATGRSAGFIGEELCLEWLAEIECVVSREED